MLRTAVCWMLTSSDKRSDGERRGYLRTPDQWRPYDPDLFDRLKECTQRDANRNVAWVKTANILPNTVFFEKHLTDSKSERSQYFTEALASVRSSDLVFFDPDNGLEIRSRPRGRKDSCKYLYSDELREAYCRGHSILVYQHFPMKKRDPFVTELAAQVCELTSCSRVFSFRTAHVVFLLVPQPRHLHHFEIQARDVASAWDSQIQFAYHSCS